jgi:hypothetical protein
MNNINNNQQNINMEQSGAAHVLYGNILHTPMIHLNSFVKQMPKIDAFINQNIDKYPTKPSQDAFRQQALLEAQTFVNRCRAAGFKPIRQMTNEMHANLDVGAAVDQRTANANQLAIMANQNPTVPPQAPRAEHPTNDAVTVSTMGQSLASSHGTRYASIPDLVVIASSIQEAIAVFQSRFECHYLKNPAVLVRIPRRPSRNVTHNGGRMVCYRKFMCLCQKKINPN